MGKNDVWKSTNWTSELIATANAITSPRELGHGPTLPDPQLDHQRPHRHRVTERTSPHSKVIRRNTKANDRSIKGTMSYYFAIIGTQDNPLFEHEFGTSKQGGDGLSRFSDQARHLNQFILHSSLDVVEEVQWNNGLMYVISLPRINRCSRRGSRGALESITFACLCSSLPSL